MICNTANVLKELFAHGKDSLPDNKLEWLGNLLESAELESANMAREIEALATAYDGLEAIQQPTPEATSSILWGLADRAETISAMVHVAKEAEFIVKERVQADKQPEAKA